MNKSATLTLKIIDQDLSDILPKTELTETQKSFVRFVARIAVQEYIKEINAAQPQQKNNQDCMLKLREVMRATSLSRASIYRYIKEGMFPKPIHVGVRSVGWKESQIAAWLRER